MESQTPIQIHIPPSLRHFAIPLTTFLSQNKQYTNLVVSSFILAPSTSSAPGPRLLIVQRAASERGFPNLWEVPGGSCEASDPTILHSLARETFEETGLRLTRFCRQIGSGQEFVSGYGARQKRWCKLGFEIEVAEIVGDDDVNSERLGTHEKVAAEEKTVGYDGVVDGKGETEGINGVSVTLDPVEHQAYAWVTESEIEEGEYPIVHAELRDLMLEAFALRKADMGKSKAMLAGATSAVLHKKSPSE